MPVRSRQLGAGADDVPAADRPEFATFLAGVVTRTKERLNAMTAVITYVGLHTDIPNSSGSNEVSGGSPAYARKAVTFASASAGSAAKNGTSPVFDVPASTTVCFLGFWSALTAGTFYGFAPVNGGTVRGVATVATTDVFTSNGHGLADTNRVYLQTVTGESLPTGLSATTLYFARDCTTDTFKVALTSGGTAVDVTAAGEVFFQATIPEVFASQATFTVSTGSIDLNG